MILRRIKRFIGEPYVRFYCLEYLGFYNSMPDKEFLEKKFKKLRMGYELNIKNPRSFNEKMQWLKLYDRNENYTRLVDKCEVKKFVANILGENHIIPTIMEWENPQDIDFDKLPKQFVLKCNHNSGLGMYICKEKATMNTNKIRKNLKKALVQEYYLVGREWPYKKIKRKILAEKYMEAENGQLNDYKVFVFEGKAELIQVDYDRFADHHRNFYDRNWNYQPFTTCYPTNKDRHIERPECLEELLDAAEILAKEIGCPHFVRIDFYVVRKSYYFGEITFYHGSGFEIFYPSEWDFVLGEWIKL